MLEGASPLSTLLAISSPPLAEPTSDDAILRRRGALGAELADLLATRNGFFTFESALHVFPLALPPGGDGTIDLLRLNDPAGSPTGWKGDHLPPCADILFFAANIFGDLYGIQGDQVIRFDPETGDVVPLSSSINGWAAWVLANYEDEIGWHTARAWQEANGALSEGLRLMPIRFFCLGGTNALDNLRPIPLLEGIALRADVARQIRDLPDGTRVRIVVE